MVFFGRKDKLEDRRLLASIDAVNGTKVYHIENGKQRPRYPLFLIGVAPRKNRRECEEQSDGLLDGGRLLQTPRRNNPGNRRISVL